jgi:hypothetical protein
MRSKIALAVGALVVVGAALSLPSCGHSQKLTGLTITPSTFTFLEPGFTAPPANPTEQYTATATYIHPPSTQDVTNLVTWAVDDGLVTMSSPGLFSATPPPAGSPPGSSGPCGGADITATLPEGTGGSENIVTAIATATVDNPANELCPGGGKLATLAVGVVGAGSVVSTPTAIDCMATGGTCVSTYAVGASVLLTASGTNVVWANCPGSSGATCVITIPTGGTAVSATFNE